MDPNDETGRRLDALSGILREEGAVLVVTVRGESMHPTLRSGSRVQARFGAGTAPRFGDLIVFRQADYLAVHRYLGIAGAEGAPLHLRARGDGRTDCDGPVPFSSLLGIVAALERADGWRSTQGPRARAYAVAVALHGRFWAEAGSLAARADRRLGRRILRPGIEAADRLFLRLADTMLFRAAHRRAKAPENAIAAS